MLKNKKIGFIGAGNMAYAIINGCVRSGAVDKKNIYVCDLDKGKLEKIVSDFSIDQVYDESGIVAEKADVIVFAVKPQIVKTVFNEIEDYIDERKLIISIAAGVSTDVFELNHSRVIRVMPNTPALVLEGASALCAGNYASRDDMNFALKLFGSIGKAVEVSEKMMDAVTGLSGSGPAYVFQFLEALSDAGVKQGLPRDIANTLAGQTVFGAAKLFIESGKHQGELKDMVTSPGGTTITGIHELEKGGMRATVMNAVEAAAKKSEELGKK